MNRYILNIIISLFLSFSLSIFANNTKPLIWNMQDLKQLKLGLSKSGEARNIIKDADKFCLITPVDIVNDKYLSFSENIHVYISMGPYRWPDPKKHGKYILVDGKVNPDSKYYDSAKLSDLCDRCIKLSKAFYLTRDKKYYDAFLLQLHAWFINKRTYMFPNFEYAQVIPDYNNNRGTSTGMVEAYLFNSVLESIRLVNSVKKIDGPTMRKLKKWFLEFADWSINTHGEVMANGKQNISVCFDITMINMYLFVGKTKKAKMLADCFAERRIYTQITEDGSQPEELCRTNAFSYSVTNITHFLDFCYLVRYWDKNYYLKHCQRIDQAIKYLIPFAENPNSFPYQQINGWKNCRNSLNQQIERRNKLLGKSN